MLVDGGGRLGELNTDPIGLKVISPFLRRLAVNRLDVVVLSHPHEDHLHGLIPILRDFRVGLVLDPGIPHGSEGYKAFLSLIEKRRIPYKIAACGQSINFGDGVRVQILNPPAEKFSGTDDDANDNSVVLRITYGKSSLLLAGDTGVEAEMDIVHSGMPMKSDVLKVAHHGSRFSTTDIWLNAVQPRIAVISVGRDNPFGHPSREVLERLARHGVKVYRTDKNGAVMVRLSRNSLSVRTSTRLKKD